MRFLWRVTVAHLAIGLAAGRAASLPSPSPAAARRGATLGACALFALLAALPDLDLVPDALGLRLVPLGHRGATHSLAFAAAVALAVAPLARRWLPGRSLLAAALAAFLTVASHALLDPLVAGSAGTPLLWPLSAARFTWAGFQPMPESLADSWPYFVPAHLALELLASAPFALYALLPRRARSAAVARGGAGDAALRDARAPAALPACADAEG